MLDRAPGAAADAAAVLTRALLACCAAALGVGAVAVGTLVLSGDAAPRVMPGVVMLGLGQAGALAAALVVAVGLRRSWPPAGPPAADGRPGPPVQDPDAGDAASPPAEAHARTSASPAPGGEGERVAGRLGLIARLLLVACVLGPVVWLLGGPAPATAAGVGALVSAQVAVLLLALRTDVRGRPRPAPPARG